MKKLRNALFVGLCIFLLLGPRVTFAALVTNTKGYWKLDESSGNPVDSSGNGNTLTNVGTMTYSSTNARINNGGNMSIVGPKYLKITNAAQSGLNITGDLTINAWVYVSKYSPSCYLTVASKYTSAGGANAQYAFRISDGVGMCGPGVLIFLMSTDGSAEVQKFSTTKISSTTMTMVTIVYTAAAGTVKFYKNGTYLAGEDGTGLPTSIASKTGDFNIGNLGDGSVEDDSWTGTEDEVGVWARALTASEIGQLYNSGRGVQYPFVAVVLWQFFTF